MHPLFRARVPKVRTVAKDSVSRIVIPSPKGVLPDLTKRVAFNQVCRSHEGFPLGSISTLPAKVIK